MAQDVMPEDEAKDIEIVAVAPTDVRLNQAKFDAIFKLAEQTDKMGRALDNIRNFVLGRAFPGDFVIFDDKLALSGPGAERIISALALMGVSVSYTNWKSWRDEGADKNGSWYTWFYQADVDIGGLHVEGVQGRAGSRDAFFGYAHGAWKDLGDVKEADIRMAARRGVIKEGIQMAMGLRGVPVEHAAKIGLDPTKLRNVGFGSAKKGTAVTGQQDQFVAKVQKVNVKREKAPGPDGKGGYKIVAVYFNNNVVAETFDTKVAEKAKSLIGQDAFVRTAAAKDPKYAPSIVEIMTATDEHRKLVAPPEEPNTEAAQEPQA